MFQKTWYYVVVGIPRDTQPSARFKALSFKPVGLPAVAQIQIHQPRRNRLCLAAFGAWHEQSHAVCTASTLLLCSPPAALAVSHRTTTLQPLAGT